MNHRLSNPTDLLALIAQGESETVEFKRSVAELEQVVETVAALAKEYCDLFGVTYTTAFRDLNTLVKTNQARKIGAGRASRYDA